MRTVIFSLLLGVCFITSCTNYGKKVKVENVEVFYKDGVTESEAQKTADLFYKSLTATNPDAKDKKSFQLSKRGDTILLKMVVQKDKIDAVPEEVFYRMMNMESETAFNNQPVNLILTDNTFDEIRSLSYKKETVEQEYGQKFVSDKIEVYANEADADAAQKLADLLNDHINPENTLSFQFANNGNNNYVVRMVTSEELNVEDITEESMEVLCKKISDQILNSQPLTLQLTDREFKELRSYNYVPKAGE